MPNHFADVAADYARFRPGYPPALYAYLAQLRPHYPLVWDVGCGNGQASLALTNLADTVIASDLSAEQIAQAQHHDKLRYFLARAEFAPLQNESVDLITVAQALHWFNLERFYAEVQRVLRKGGLLVIWTYRPVRLRNAELDDVVQRFYHDVATPWWPPGREHVDNGYQLLTLPYTQCDAADFVMEQSLTRQQFCGYVRTWSAMAKLRSASGVDAVLQLDQQLQPGWHDNTIQTVFWPLRLRACCKPF